MPDNHSTDQIAGSSVSSTLRLDRPSSSKCWIEAAKKLSDNDRKSLDFNDDEQNDPLNGLVEAIQEKRDLCQQKRWKFKRKNGEYVILRDLCEKMIKWVNKFKAVGDAAIQFDPIHAALPWAAVRFCLQASVNDVQAFGAMLEGFESVTIMITRYAYVETLYADATTWGSQVYPALIKLYVAILQYLAKCARFFSRDIKTRLLKSVFNATDVETFMQNIQDKENTVQAVARIADAARTQSIAVQAEKQQNQLAQILQQLEQPMIRHAGPVQADKLSKNQRLELFRWLSSIENRKHHTNSFKGVLSDTGNWLKEKAEYRCWRDSSVSSILWLHGMPGCGKSKLMSLIIDELLKESKTIKSPAPVAYFYCTRDPAEPERSDPGEVFKSLLKQLACSSPANPIRSPLVEEYRRRKEEADEDGSPINSLEIEETVQIMQNLTDQNSAVIIIDALDECQPQTRWQLFKYLDQLVAGSASLIKVFVSSRDDSDIVQTFEHAPSIRVGLEDNYNDIERFTEFAVAQAINDRRLLDGKVSIDLKRHIISTLVTGAKGMFRWVEMQVKNLCDPERIKLEVDAREELARLPAGLAETYDVTYRQISRLAPRGRLKAESAFKWLLCARRQMSSREFLVYVAVGSDEREALLNAKQLLALCCNLVELDMETDRFRFAHLSVREYLECKAIYDLTSANYFACNTCLNIYSLQASGSGITESPSSILQSVQNSEIREYAALYWPFHYKSLSSQIRNQLAEAILNLAVGPSERSRSPPSKSSEHLSLSPSPSRHSQAKTTLWSDDLKSLNLLPFLPHEMDRFLWDISVNERPCLVLLSCYFDLPELLTTYKKHAVVDLTRKNFFCGNALQVAIDRGSYPLLNHLFEDSDSKTKLLVDCAYSLNLSLMRELLRIGYDVNACDKHNQSLLHIACRYQDMNMVTVLLTNGADANYINNYLETALHIAAASPSADARIVKLLCQYEADIDHESDSGTSPLQVAAGQAGPVIVAALLDYGADINHADKKGVNAIMEAASTGQIRNVMLLASRGATLGPKHICNNSKRATAVLSKFIETTRNFLQQDPEIDVYRLTNDNISQLLLLYVDQQMFSQLVFWGIYLASTQEPSTLHMAMRRRNAIEVVDAFVKDINENTRLHIAALCGNLGLVYKLCETDLDAGRENLYGESPLHLALLGGHVAITMFLRAKNPDSINGCETYPLLVYLVRYGTINMLDLARVLLNAGEDVNRVNLDSHTAMVHALWRGDDELIDFLKAEGAIRDAKIEQQAEEFRDMCDWEETGKQDRFSWYFDQYG